MDIPEIDKSLAERIKIVRRDIGNLLFHFTRVPDAIAGQVENDGNALAVLKKILEEGKLLGSSNWIKNNKRCICFTEAPIHEFAALFSLVKLAANEKQRPRYEPYGIAVGKDWLYKKGGRPVIYDNEEVYRQLPETLRYRYVHFDPEKGVDCSWEREWRICCDELFLDSEETLVVTPDAKTAFDIAFSYSEEDTYSFSEKNVTELPTQEVGKTSTDIKTNQDESYVKLITRKPKWMAVSLDLFDIKP